ncbi:hypothetical protein HMPREF1549_00101 [Actinomyces johnsonii F0510]|uniref:Uncharacterized protein n=1 Tax=Actinomyces johnsonii F0510 TaxID=1227262 RepID=U1QNH3_9ACTO|nr:hypothetical protein HMPREF1549_00101 [Actinomyces johnsonii F0510]
MWVSARNILADAPVGPGAKGTDVVPSSRTRLPVPIRIEGD